MPIIMGNLSIVTACMLHAGYQIIPLLEFIYQPHCGTEHNINFECKNANMNTPTSTTVCNILSDNTRINCKVRVASYPSMTFCQVLHFKKFSL